MTWLIGSALYRRWHSFQPKSWPFTLLSFIPHIQEHYLDEFESKMVGLVGVSGGPSGAINALNSLRTIGRSLHAWVIPEQVSVPQAWNTFDSSGNLKDSRLADRLMGVGREVARYASLHAAGDDPEFLELWQNAPQNPGAER